MKLALAQLEAHLSKPLHSIYIIASDELLLVQEAADLIRHAASLAGFTERTLISVDPGSDWGKSLYSNTHSLSLFAEKRFVELNLHNAKFNATTTKSLQEYAQNPPSDTLLLIRTNKIDSKTEKSAWFQALEKKSIFLSLWPIPALQLPQWIMQRAKKLGLSITKQTAELIAQQTEGNLLAASQEIEKLSLLASTSDIEITTDNAHFDVFDLVDSVITSNHSRSLRILKNLAAEDTEPTLVLWALTREFRTMTEMFYQIKQGATIASLLSKFHIYEKRQAMVRHFLQKQSLQKCLDLLLNASQIDHIIKGASPGNVWDELERLALL